MRRPILLLLFFPLFAAGQDIHFSQYLYSPLNLNPALTGMFNGDIRANALYRQQWNSITVPYKTFSLSYDQAIVRSGSRNAAGIVINNDVAGDGNYGTMQVLLSYARLFSLDADSVHFLNAAMQAGISYRNLDTDKLKFDNQFNGDSYNPMIATGENFDRTNYIYPEINAGIVYMNVSGNATSLAGISMQHFMTPEQTFLDNEAPLPMRLQGTLSSNLFRDNSFSLLPSMLIMKQKKFSELIFGVEGILRKEPLSSNAISIGIHYRTSDAIIPSVALYYNLWRFGVSYDINTSDLQKASNNKGGPEFNITYVLRKIRYVPSKNLCPVY